MDLIGYKLVEDISGTVVREWGGTFGQCPGIPNPVVLPVNGEHVCGWVPGSSVNGYTLTEWRAVSPTTAGDVNRERDRRLRQFVFGGKAYDFCDGRGSDINIAGAGTLALAAIIAGAQPGNLRWANADTDFGWIAADNTMTTMDAQTCLLFAQAAAAWKAGHIHTARVIKNLETIPADYAADARWPS